MARTRRVKKDGDAHYHVMSRTNGRRFLFEKGDCKGEMVRLLKVAAAFSGVSLEAYCIMDDHFHSVCKVVKPDAPLSESEVLERIAILKGHRFADDLADHWAELRQIGADAAVDAALKAWRHRMHDLSEFTKTFKELVNVWYKARHRYCGGLWSGRFKSTLVQDREYLRTCIRYVELNPVRAGMVSRAKDYDFSSQNGDKPLPDVPFAGSVPDGRLLRRVAQIGGGIIFGSFEFVRGEAMRHGACFKARHVGPKAVFSGGEGGLSPEEGGLSPAGAYASHGWRLAKVAA